VNYPKEVLNRAARVFGMSGYMLGERLLLRLLLPCLGLGLVVAFVDDGMQQSARRPRPFPFLRRRG
jgi:hypothetical protein